MLTIGEFSRACQVTIKTLHHYDKLDLVKPAYIDPQNGYRYYESNQVPQLLLIQRLKRYGFSLAEIQQILSTEEKGTLVSKLSAQKTILEQQIRESGIILHELEQHLNDFERTGNIMSYQNKYEITLKQTEDTPVVSVRQQMSVEEFGTYCGKLFERIAREHIIPAGDMRALYYDREFHHDSADIEIAMPVTKPEQADHIIPGNLCAFTIHRGAYSSMSDAYGAITKWIADNNYEIVNAPYDIYRIGPNNNVPPEQWETEIYFPVKTKEI